MRIVLILHAPTLERSNRPAVNSADARRTSLGASDEAGTLHVDTSSDFQSELLEADSGVLLAGIVRHDHACLAVEAFERTIDTLATISECEHSPQADLHAGMLSPAVLQCRGRLRQHGRLACSPFSPCVSPSGLQSSRSCHKRRVHAMQAALRLLHACQPSFLSAPDPPSLVQKWPSDSLVRLLNTLSY